MNLSAALTPCRIFCEGRGDYEVTATIVNRMAARESGHEGRYRFVLYSCSRLRRAATARSPLLFPLMIPSRPAWFGARELPSALVIRISSSAVARRFPQALLPSRQSGQKPQGRHCGCDRTESQHDFVLAAVVRELHDVERLARGHHESRLSREDWTRVHPVLVPAKCCMASG